MRRFILVAGVVAASLIASWAVGAQEKGLTVDGDGNVEISGNLTVLGSITASGLITASGGITASGNITASEDITASGSITASGDITASGEIMADGNIKTVGYFSKKFGGSGYYHLDSSGPLYGAYWYEGADASVTSISEPETIAKGLKLVQGMKGMSYVRQTDKAGGRQDYGLMPDGIENLLPTVLVKDQSGRAWVDDRHAVVFLVEAIKEQQRLIETLQNELKSIATRLNQTTPNPR